MKHPLLLLLIIILISSCIFSTNDLTPSDIKGCYLTSIPDPYSPDANPPLVDLYIQLWEDGTGEGGFWDDPLTESRFFSWEIEDDTLRISDEFDLFDNCKYYIESNDSSIFLLKAQQDQTLIATFYLSDEDISRVDYTSEQIIGSWNSSSSSLIYTFSQDGSLQITDVLPTSWEKGDIPYTLEIGNGSEWAVRMYNDNLVIMAGYNNILTKQP